MLKKKMQNFITKKPLLSFAIPTYNFGKFIEETIKSIIEGAVTLTNSDYEIIILDSGSKDNTEQVVAALMQQYANIRYVKNITRGGIDHDLNEVVGLAIGKYIWLFSADDLLVNGWDLDITPLLSREKDIYLVPAELCDLYMKHLRNNPIFKSEDSEPIEFKLNGDMKSIDLYLEKANTLEALFSFMSAVIVRNDVWHRLKERSDYYGSCWAHCARLLPLLFQDTSIFYVNKFLIRKRGGNDSFMENGLISRIGIGIHGWWRIIFEYFDKQSQRELLIQTLRKDLPILLFIYAKITAKGKQEVVCLDTMARDLYWTWSTKWTTKINYVFYRTFPGATKISLIIRPFLPWLIRIRHKIKSLFPR